MVMARLIVPFAGFCKARPIDAVRLMGHGQGVSTDTDLDPTKKHRHDVGAVDHGALRTEATTRARRGWWVVATWTVSGLLAVAGEAVHTGDAEAGGLGIGIVPGV